MSIEFHEVLNKTNGSLGKQIRWSYNTKRSWTQHVIINEHLNSTNNRENSSLPVCMKIMIRTQWGGTITINIKNSMTNYDLKRAIIANFNEKLDRSIKCTRCTMPPTVRLHATFFFAFFLKLAAACSVAIYNEKKITNEYERIRKDYLIGPSESCTSWNILA